MKCGIIGLGKMGFAIASRAHRAHHTIIGFDADPEMRNHARQAGITVVTTIDALPHDCDVLWLMVPAGPIVDAVLSGITPYCTPQTIIIDGGNSHFKDSIRRAQQLMQKGISYLDCGTSGGIHGLAHGFCLMVGGTKEAYTKIEPLLQAIATPQGVAHVGPSGAGHYVKMVHNGIEYGLLQAYAEGFQLLKQGNFGDELDLHQIAAVWQEGSVIRSFLLSLCKNIFAHDQDLSTIIGSIPEGGTGRWTVENAHEHHIPLPVIEAALQVRQTSREKGDTYATKVVALLREQFGGHAVIKNNK
jgi:6-phosphogluconate dehydrogenase